MGVGVGLSVGVGDGCGSTSLHLSRHSLYALEHAMRFAFGAVLHALNASLHACSHSPRGLCCPSDVGDQNNTPTVMVRINTDNKLTFLITAFLLVVAELSQESIAKLDHTTGPFRGAKVNNLGRYNSGDESL